jgi:soluble lytic murein transglycosylase-like protein
MNAEFYTSLKRLACLRVSYPLTWLIACAAVLILAPSLFSATTGFTTRGSVSLGLAGLTSYEVTYRFEDEHLTAVEDALRLKPYLARLDAQAKKKVFPKRKRRVYSAKGPVPFHGTIERIAREHGVSPALAAAVIKVESGFKPHVRSRRGARGLMQLLPATARKVGVRGNIYDPERNIRAGVRYLKMMLERYNGDERLALAAYNAGPGAVDRYNNVPPYRETRHYVPLVLQYVREYKKYFRDI